MKKKIVLTGGILAVLFCIVLITGCPQSADSAPILKITETFRKAELRILTFNKTTKKGTFEDQDSAPGSPIISGDFEITITGGSKKFKITNSSDPTLDGSYGIGTDNKVSFGFHEYNLTPLMALLN